MSEADLAFIEYNEWQREWQLKYDGGPTPHALAMPGFRSIHDPDDFERVVAILRSWGASPVNVNGWTVSPGKVTIPVQEGHG